MLREWSLILYGTTNAIRQSDPISPRVVMSTPISNSFKNNVSLSTTTPNFHQHYSAQYPRIPPSKQKKPPPYHQVSATYGVIYGTNNKNKPKNQKNNKDNKNQQPVRNNYYRITSINKSGEVATLTTTARPKKISSKKEKNGLKAPKQIKDNHRAFTTTSSTTHSSSTANPRIKLFEKYEKIQQIFPEFEPYTTSTKQSQKFIATSSSINTGDPKEEFEVLEIVNSGLDGNDNRKPSRENSPSKKQKNRGNSEMKDKDNKGNNNNDKINKLKEQLYVPNSNGSNPSKNS